MSNQPPIEVPQGAIRLNTDSQRLEFFAQDRWYEMATDSPTIRWWHLVVYFLVVEILQIITAIEFITISTQGNSQDFSDLSDSWTSLQGAAAASRTRGLYGRR